MYLCPLFLTETKTDFTGVPTYRGQERELVGGPQELTCPQADISEKAVPRFLRLTPYCKDLPWT